MHADKAVEDYHGKYFYYFSSFIPPSFYPITFCTRMQSPLQNQNQLQQIPCICHLVNFIANIMFFLRDVRYTYISIFMVTSQGYFHSAQLLRIGRTSFKIKKKNAIFFLLTNAFVYSPHKIILSTQFGLCISQGYYVAMLECYVHKVLLKNDIITNILKLFILCKVTSQPTSTKAG